MKESKWQAQEEIKRCPYKDSKDGICTCCLLRSRGYCFREVGKHEFLSNLRPHDDGDGCGR